MTAHNQHTFDAQCLCQAAYSCPYPQLQGTQFLLLVPTGTHMLIAYTHSHTHKIKYTHTHINKLKINIKKRQHPLTEQTFHLCNYSWCLHYCFINNTDILKYLMLTRKGNILMTFLNCNSRHIVLIALAAFPKGNIFVSRTGQFWPNYKLLLMLSWEEI